MSLDLTPHAGAGGFGIQCSDGSVNSYVLPGIQSYQAFSGSQGVHQHQRLDRQALLMLRAVTWDASCACWYYLADCSRMIACLIRRARTSKRRVPDTLTTCSSLAVSKSTFPLTLPDVNNVRQAGGPWYSEAGLAKAVFGIGPDGAHLPDRPHAQVLQLRPAHRRRGPGGRRRRAVPVAAPRRRLWRRALQQAVRVRALQRCEGLIKPG